MRRIIPYEFMVSHMMDQVKPIASGKVSKRTAQEVREGLIRSFRGVDHFILWAKWDEG